MNASPLLPEEAARVELLCALNILDAAPQDSFARITELSSTLLKSPVAVVSIMDEHRAWLQSSLGVRLSRTPQSLPFCAHVIQQREMLVVPDALADDRFADSPVVRREPHVRFYAGAPLRSATGMALGTLCIMGPQPRELTPTEAATLSGLAELVSQKLMVRELSASSEGALMFRLELGQEGSRCFTYVSEGIAAMVGLSLAELYDDAAVFLQRVHPEDREPLARLLSHPPKECTARFCFRVVNPRRPEPSWYEARANVRYGLGGTIIWSGFLSDVTQRVEMETHWREHDRLRMTAVLATGLAHDFNNLLGSMMGLAEICRDQAEEGSRQRRNLQRIMDSGSRAAGLIRQLLDFARQSEPELKATRLGELVTELSPLLQVSLPHGVELALEIAEGQDAPVAVDRGQIEQVLHNLVRNAGYAMKDRGGTVRLCIESREAPRSPLRVPSLRLAVVDTGCGIATADLERVFDPFFTTKPVGEGSGLGLSSAHGIVTRHNGVIQARSAPGEGSTFVVWLPVATAA